MVLFLSRGGMDTIQVLRGQFASAVSSAMEDADTGSKNLLSSIDRKNHHNPDIYK